LLPLRAESGNFGITLIGEPEPDVRLIGVACPDGGERDVAWLHRQDGSEAVHCEH
jgi:hypothetical protein